MCGDRFLVEQTTVRNCRSVLRPFINARTGCTAAPLQLPDSQTIIPTTPPDQHLRFQVLTRLADPGMVTKWISLNMGMIGAKRFTGWIPAAKPSLEMTHYQQVFGQWGG